MGEWFFSSFPPVFFQRPNAVSETFGPIDCTTWPALDGQNILM